MTRIHADRFRKFCLFLIRVHPRDPRFVALESGKVELFSLFANLCFFASESDADRNWGETDAFSRGYNRA
jgi:hypothetical protein